MAEFKIGVIREGKVPPDKRVPLTPLECVEVQEKFSNANLVVQPSQIRTYKDSEYSDLGLTMQEDLNDCDILVGVKEVPLEMLIPNKTYFFFSHTTKEQPYNQKLLRTVLDKNIRLVDWENLVNPRGSRVIAFGRYAGIVGAYNGVLTYGKKHDLFHLKPANECFDMEEMQGEYAKVKLPNIKIVLTGGGRVSKGAMEVLDGMGIRKVSVEEYLNESFDEAVYCQIGVQDYNKRKDGADFDKKEFYSDPSGYESNFKRFSQISDMLVAGAFWDHHAPKLFSKEEAGASDFKINVVADITMDIDGSVGTTQRPATIPEPNYDFVRGTAELVEPFSNPNHITVMAVDNLPCELPRDASRDFGRELIDNVLPNLLGEDPHNMIGDAAITTLEGTLTEKYSYLQDYADGKKA